MILFSARDTGGAVLSRESEKAATRGFRLWVENLRALTGPKLEQAINRGLVDNLFQDWDAVWQHTENEAPDWSRSTNALMVETGAKELKRLRFGMSFTLDNPFAE